MIACSGVPRPLSAKPTMSPRSLIAFACTSDESVRGDVRIVVLGEQAASPIGAAAPEVAARRLAAIAAPIVPRPSSLVRATGAPRHRIVRCIVMAHLRLGSLPATVPNGSARRDPREAPTSVARREEFLTVWQGSTAAWRVDSVRGPLRARRAIGRPRWQVELPLLAAEIPADDRARAATPDRRVDVPQHRACVDSRGDQ